MSKKPKISNIALKCLEPKPDEKSVKFAKYEWATPEDIDKAETPIDKMAEGYFVTLNLREGMTEKELHYVKQMCLAQAEKKCALYVLYKSSCDCEGYATVLLDRFPMSPKIRALCSKCNKGGLMTITDPPIFYEPLRDIEFPLKDLLNMQIMTGTRQSEYLQAYKDLAEGYKKVKRPRKKTDLSSRFTS